MQTDLAAKPPGRRDRQKQERRDRMLDAARALFHERGYEVTAIADIAAYADVSVPTVFNYFGTKDGILLELITAEHDQWRARVKAMREEESGDPATRIGAFLVATSDNSLRHADRATWRHVEAACIRQPTSDFVKRYKVLADSMGDAFAGLLEDLVARGKAPATMASPAIAAMLFNHWGVRFVALVTDDAMTFEVHAAQLCDDAAALVALALSPP
jgi:AcrR family transcriptional regulator